PEGLMVADSFMVYVEKEFMFIVSYESSPVQNQDTIILCNDADQITFKVSTEVTWNYTNTYSWLALEVREDSMLSVAFSSNLTGDDRVGDITLFDAQGHEVKIILKQTENCLNSVFSSGPWVDLKMYPNPVSDKLFIETGDQFQRELRLEVIDYTGKLLYIEEVPEGIHEPLQIDMQGFTEGVYFIRIRDGAGMGVAVPVIKE
ncbi:MAG: T9SS type A sorting domain-containing protein, partial [Bacteroidales bacterium]|nr:T9SS type A sorting domain-containing protein [Bacteroidales bacterium]